MISLICSNCSHTISVDEGFAGGVCRCVHCGAIQTVPELGAAKSGRPAFGGKTLYQKPSDGPAGELGQLSRAANVPTRGTAGATAPKSSATPIIIGAIGAAVVGVLAVGFFLWRGGAAAHSQSSHNAPIDDSTGAAPNRATPSNDVPGAQTPTTPSRPSFGAIDLSGPTIIYVLDRGDATGEFLAGLLRATAASARSLGPSTRFQIIFWTSDEESPAFPESGPAPATPATVAAALQQMSSQIAASRATSLLPALDRALGESPAQMVVATGKGSSIDDELADQVIARVRDREKTSSRRIKLHVVDLQRNSAEESPSPQLQRIASATSGVYLQVDPAKLEQIAGR